MCIGDSPENMKPVYFCTWVILSIPCSIMWNKLEPVTIRRTMFDLAKNIFHMLGHFDFISITL